MRAPDDGEIRILGKDARRDARHLKERIGIQLQTTGLYPKLTVREVIELFASFYTKRVPTDDLIAMTGLAERAAARTQELSGGQKQRLSVALALVNDPDLIFLDEPTTGLDPQARRNLWDLVNDLKKRSKTILLTTHYMEEAEQLCDLIAVMDHGKIIALDTPGGLVRTNFQEQAISFESLQPPPLETLTALPGVARAQIQDTEITVFTKDVPATMGGLLALSREGTLHFDNLVVRRASLEDVFLKLTGRSIRE